MATSNFNAREVDEVLRRLWQPYVERALRSQTILLNRMLLEDARGRQQTLDGEMARQFQEERADFVSDFDSDDWDPGLEPPDNVRDDGDLE